MQASLVQAAYLSRVEATSLHSKEYSIVVTAVCYICLWTSYTLLTPAARASPPQRRQKYLSGVYFWWFIVVHIMLSHDSEYRVE